MAFTNYTNELNTLVVTHHSKKEEREKKEVGDFKEPAQKDFP